MPTMVEEMLQGLDPGKSEEAKNLEAALLAFNIKIGRVPKHKGAAVPASQVTTLALAGAGGEIAEAAAAAPTIKPTASKASSDTEVGSGRNGRERTPPRPARGGLAARDTRAGGASGGK